MMGYETWLPWIGCGSLTYMVGSVNLVILATRSFKIGDVTATGSDNPGVTNLFRAGGPKLAIPVLVAELAKASLTIWLIGIAMLGEMAVLLIIPYLLGNLFPLFHRFQGGKGVAAVVGTLIAVHPLIMLLGGGVFIAVFVLTKRVSAGSIAMTGSYPVLSLLLDAGRPIFVTTVVAAVIILLTHRANILRLIRGTETQLQSAHKEKNEA